MNYSDIAVKISQPCVKRTYSDTYHNTMSRAVMPDGGYVTPGMPPLEPSVRAVSFFEFWPSWLIYGPVAIQWLMLSLYYRSLSLPLIANPNILSAGMVGFSKSELLAQAQSSAQKWILPWVTHTLTEYSVADQTSQLLQSLTDNKLLLPIVGKPDMGCRGVGIKLITTESELYDYVKHYPVNSTLMLQRLADWEPEAGVFYVRYPNEAKGRIVSMALKYSPYVVGDGTSTLRQLLAADARASQVTHLYETRHQDKLDQVIVKNEPFRLVFAASHSRGAIFCDAKQYITEALTHRIDEIMLGFPEFYYGRLDIKFNTVEHLMQGEDFAIIEVNGASSESLNIWDKRTKLREAWATLFSQYHTLFKIGAMNRQRGYTPPGILSLWRAWRMEQALSKHHPATD